MLYLFPLPEKSYELNYNFFFHQATVKYVDLETTALQSMKEASTAAVLNNREKKKNEFADFFKFIVRTANASKKREN